MPELAKAYVQIVPSAEGIQGKLQSALGGEAGNAGLSAGKDFAAAFGSLLGGAAMVTAATKAGKIIGEALVNSIRDTAEYGDMVDKQSQVLGISAQAYQEWEAVLQHSGTTMESMTGAFRTLANAAQDSTDDQVAAFEMIGLSMDEVRAMSTEDLFGAVIMGLQQMDEGTERTAAAIDLLGRGAMNLGPLLNTSADDTQEMIDRVNELGGVMSQDAVDSAADYSDAMQDLQTVADGLKHELGGSLLPIMTGLIEVTLDGVAAMRQFGGIDFTTMLMPLVGISNAIAGKDGPGNAVGLLGDALNHVGDVAEEAASKMDPLADAMTEEEIAAQEATQSIWDIANASLDAIETGDDLRDAYNDLTGELDSLREAGDETAIMWAEHELAILNVLATNQELESSYPGLVDSVGRFGFSVSELSGWLIDNGITAEEWGEQVQSATDGIVNSFQLMNTDLGLSIDDMAANLQANIDATRDWNTNMAALWQKAASDGQAGAMEFVQYLQDMGPAAATQVAAMAQDLQGTLDTFAPMFADAADQGVLQMYNAIEGANADTAAGDMMQSAVDAAGAVTGWDTMASEDVDQVISGISGGSAGVSGEASGMMQSAQSAAAGVGGWSGIGYNVAAGVAAGIRSGASAVVSAAVSMVTQAAAAARAAAQIASPSKLFKNEIGAFLPAGVAEGIEDNMRPLLESSRNMMQQSLLAADQASSFRSFGQAPLVLGDNETLTLLQTYLPQLARMSVTLQDGAVVGQLTPRIDTELGERQTYAVRGLA